MYKVFLNRFQINLTSKAKFLDKTNTFLLVSIDQKEILKKLRAGTDHASIATEAKVVNMLKEKNIDKHSISKRYSPFYIFHNC